MGDYAERAKARRQKLAEAKAAYEAATWDAVQDFFDSLLEEGGEDLLKLAWRLILDQGEAYLKDKLS